MRFSDASSTRRPPRAVSGEVVAAAIMTILALPLSVVGLVQAPSASIPSGEAAWLIGVCVALHATGLLCAWRPTVAFAAGSVLMLVLAFTVIPGIGSAAMLPSSIVYLLLVWKLASGEGRRISILALVVGLVGAGVIAVASAGQTGEQDPMWLLFEGATLVAGVVAAWALGVLTRRYRRAEASRVEESMRRAVAEERTMISRDLHDVVSHALTVMIAQAEAARIVIGADGSGITPTGDAALEKVAETGREAMRGLRSMIRTLDESDAAPLTPTSGIAAVGTLVENARSTEHTITLTAQGMPECLALDADLAAFRVVQEGVTNSIRHVKPPVGIQVTVDWSDTAVVITVRDDGGSGVKEPSDAEGTGLIGLAERVERAGGTLDVSTSNGWCVRAVLPTEVTS
ncbi:histidine kinase [Propionimicrobium sp. PCR01-08-3]|uniref:sensor histidine kinase n=1 Tax=Propionimicrobium sp. PCR01-08-3 TaxID=3052086 RepID=UPI00255C34F1|nr:histidine kinase [Propionimicrobium sp. PCR01-08-3]WIY82219.1 histidine kinase [Propionimicrobium sp. PCR01-08-3]